MPSTRNRPPPSPPRVIYWAEDAMDDRFLIQDALRDLPGRPAITFFDDGQPLIERLASRLPDLIVLDIRMPRMDGLQTLERIRKMPKGRHIPVVMFSTAMIEEEVQACKMMEVAAFVQKPAAYPDFQAAVARIVQMDGIETRTRVHA